MSKFEELKQAVESYIIAANTGTRKDEVAAYIRMLTVAELTEYLP